MPLWLIPCVPAAAAVLNGLAGDRPFGKRGAAAIACAAAGLCVVLAAVAFKQLHGLDPAVSDETLGQWMPPMPLDTAGGITVLSVPWTLRLDRLSAMLLLVVSGAGLIAHLIVVTHASEDVRSIEVRQLAVLSLLCAATLLTLLAGNLFVMFPGWEGVGLCTYFLLTPRDEAAAPDRDDATWSLMSGAASGAMLLAFIVMLFTFGTVDFREVGNDAVSSPRGGGALAAIVVLLCAAAAAKLTQGSLRLRTAAVAGRVGFAAAVLVATTNAVAATYLVARNRTLFEQVPLAVPALSAIVFAAVAAVTLTVPGRRP
jgi:NADH-quinone oxidoreductase subunit L